MRVPGVSAQGALHNNVSVGKLAKRGSWSPRFGAMFGEQGCTFYAGLHAATVVRSVALQVFFSFTCLHGGSLLPAGKPIFANTKMKWHNAQ